MAADAVTRTVALTAGTRSGHHLILAAAALGGTSGGSDVVNAPYSTLAPTPLESGRLHIARHLMTGTAFPSATFSWLTTRRCIALAAAYGEFAVTPPEPPPVVENTAQMWNGTALVPLEIQIPSS